MTIDHDCVSVRVFPAARDQSPWLLGNSPELGIVVKTAYPLPGQEEYPQASGSFRWLT